MLFDFKGFFNYESRCEIDIHGNVVIATQLHPIDRPGTSVTNASEIIAKDVCDKFNMPYDKLIFIEHYVSDVFDKEVYSQVTFTVNADGFTEPSWRKVSLNEVAAIINEQEDYNFNSTTAQNRLHRAMCEINFIQELCPHTFTDHNNKCKVCMKELI